MALAVSSRSMRLIRPVSTLPAPTRRSVHALLPHLENAFAPAHQPGHLLHQQTLDLDRVALRRGADVGDQRHHGGRSATSPRPRPFRLGGGRISAQWKGALTGNISSAWTPRSAAMTMARSTAALSPLNTTCPGALSLAAPQISACAAASAGDRRAQVEIDAEHAAIAPSPTGTAAASTGRGASRAARHRRAEAPRPGERRIFAERMAGDVGDARAEIEAAILLQHASTARLAAISAGCAFSVRTRSLSGPSNMRRERRWLSASSISAKTSRAVTKAPARSRPMPTACEPCPGKTRARVIPLSGRSSANPKLDGVGIRERWTNPCEENRI